MKEENTYKVIFEKSNGLHEVIYLEGTSEDEIRWLCEIFYGRFVRIEDKHDSSHISPPKSCPGSPRLQSEGD